jgi:hypothetical protein
MSAWYDLAWQSDLANLCGNEHVTKPWRATSQGFIFSLLVVCCVKFTVADTSNYSLEKCLVASVRMHNGQHTTDAGSGDDTISAAIRKAISVQSNCFIMGRTCLIIQECERLSSKWSTNILKNDVYHCCCFHWKVTTQVRSENISENWSTMFNHVWPLWAL